MIYSQYILISEYLPWGYTGLSENGVYIQVCIFSIFGELNSSCPELIWNWSFWKLNLDLTSIWQVWKKHGSEDCFIFSCAVNYLEVQLEISWDFTNFSAWWTAEQNSKLWFGCQVKNIASTANTFGVQLFAGAAASSQRQPKARPAVKGGLM